MRIKTVVVDNEINDIQLVQNCLNSISSASYSFDISTITNPTELKTFEKYCIYILDIDMPQESGFELARRIMKASPKSVIVFCTQHDDLVFNSFNLDVFYFIRKNSLHDDMQNMLRKYVKFYEADNLLYLVKTADRQFELPFDEIRYFEVSGNDLYIYKIDGTCIRERKTMKQLSQEELPDWFLHASYQFLINAKCIRVMNTNSFVLDNHQEIPFPRNRAASIREQYLLYRLRK